MEKRSGATTPAPGSQGFVAVEPGASKKHVRRGSTGSSKENKYKVFVDSRLESTTNKKNTANFVEKFKLPNDEILIESMGFPTLIRFSGLFRLFCACKRTRTEGFTENPNRLFLRAATADFRSRQTFHLVEFLLLLFEDPWIPHQDHHARLRHHTNFKKRAQHRDSDTNRNSKKKTRQSAMCHALQSLQSCAAVMRCALRSCAERCSIYSRHSSIETNRTKSFLKSAAAIQTSGFHCASEFPKSKKKKKANWIPFKPTLESMTRTCCSTIQIKKIQQVS
jgi:hypothetical protein